MPKRRTFTAEFKSQLVLKVISGVTSLEEVMRVTAERGGDA